MTDKKLSVLIVDDHQNFVRRLVGLLDEVDSISSIETAGNYNDAFQILEDRQPDIVLLDISLPGKSGMDLLAQIKDHSWHCTVIMLSNMSATYYKQECKRLGAGYFLDKTNEFELLPGILTSFHPN